jgi:PAS domain S-box-containing protein
LTIPGPWELRYRTLVETSPDSILLLSLDGKILFGNHQTAALHGYPNAEALTGASISDLFAPDEVDLAWDVLRRSLARDRVHNVACTMRRQDGTQFAADVSVSVVRDAALRPTSYIAVTRDVTSHQRVEEQLQASVREKDMLLSEIHHRVKSNLQIVSSLLYLQALDAPDRQTSHILEDSRRRVHSMALVHERLYGSADLTQIDMRPYIDDLTSSLMLGREERTSAVELVTELQDVTMPVDAAIPCGLLVNELVSNALLHAFPEGQDGRIELLCRREGDEYVLEVNDDGTGMPALADKDAPPTLGMQLVNMLVEQLHGTLEVESGEGTRVRIRFPTPRATQEESIA